MCFNSKTSIITFCIGTIFSILLFYGGNKKYITENKVTGIFLIFISCIQFMDFLFWIDIKNKYGINKITTILGPILNVCQPILLYLIKYAFYIPSMTSFNVSVASLNILYGIYFIYNYVNFLNHDKLITKTENGHLKWPWIAYFNPRYYILLFAINIFYLFDFYYAMYLFVITYTFLWISYKYFYYNAGELWCFFGSFIPLIMFVLSFYI
uniref:Uncharacterized protein n=1 Tax=viral metagenome TaxID=1070528 RepID=A0A6C0JX10_9ZZZZ